jgi:K+ transporter
MNWDAIGAVGEMIGALALVVTIAYLALQVRASTNESEGNAFTVTGNHRSTIRGRFMEHADV